MQDCFWIVSVNQPAGAVRRPGPVGGQPTGAALGAGTESQKERQEGRGGLCRIRRRVYSGGEEGDSFSNCLFYASRGRIRSPNTSDICVCVSFMCVHGYLRGSFYFTTPPPRDMAELLSCKHRDLSFLSFFFSLSVALVICMPAAGSPGKGKGGSSTTLGRETRWHWGVRFRA